MCCPDGAIHDTTKPNNRGVVTYSLTLCSRVLIEKLGIKLSSRRWAVPQVQLNCKETTTALHHIMQDRFNELNLIKKYKDTDIHFYDVGDCKCLYSMTGHSLWNRNGHPFLRCACKRGMAADEKHVCTMIGDNDYSDY